MEHPIRLVSYKEKLQMATLKDHVKLAGKLSAKLSESRFDIFKNKKYYFKLYSDRLEAFSNTESSIGNPKFTIYPEEGTYISKAGSPPNTIKIQTNSAKMVIETGSDDMQIKWMEALKAVFGDKPNSEQVTDRNSGIQSANTVPECSFKINFLKEKNPTNSSTQPPSHVPMNNTKFNLPGGKLNSEFPPPFSYVPTESLGIEGLQINNLTKLNRKDCSTQPISSISPANPLKPPRSANNLKKLTIVPSDELYDEVEDYEFPEEEKEKNKLGVIPIGAARVAYGNHGWPLILKFNDGKIVLMNSSGSTIENWQLKYIRKFSCKSDMFFFETGHKCPGGSKILEFQLVERASKEVISDISGMIHQEMKLVSTEKSTKHQEKNTAPFQTTSAKLNLSGMPTKPNFPLTPKACLVSSNQRIPSGALAKQNPVLPPPFSLKPKIDPERSTILTPSDDLYDEYVEYIAFQENVLPKPSQPSPPIKKLVIIPSDELYDEVLEDYEECVEIPKQKEDSKKIYECLWNHSTASTVKSIIPKTKPPTQYENNASTKDEMAEQSEPIRYKGPIDDSLYALPSSN